MTPNREYIRQKNWRCNMLITCQYLDKKAAAVEALKDYSSIQYIISSTVMRIYMKLKTV